MKNQHLLVLFVLLFIVSACKKEGLSYKNYQVVFFTSHPDYTLLPPVFEEVNEKVIARERHRRGAIFETVTEQLVVKEGYTTYRIANPNSVHVVVDAESDIIGSIDCHTFAHRDDVTEIYVPAVYETRNFERLVTDGTGDIQTTVYLCRSYEKVREEAQLVEHAESQKGDTLNFRIPADMSIHDYLADQFANQHITACVAENSYQILE